MAGHQDLRALRYLVWEHFRVIQLLDRQTSIAPASGLSRAPWRISRTKCQLPGHHFCLGHVRQCEFDFSTDAMNVAASLLLHSPSERAEIEQKRGR